MPTTKKSEEIKTAKQMAKTLAWELFASCTGGEMREEPNKFNRITDLKMAKDNSTFQINLMKGTNFLVTVQKVKKPSK